MPKPFRALHAALPLVFVALLLALPFAGAPAHAASPAGKNLLQNGDFERTLAGHPWMPAGWDTSLADLPTVFFGRDTFMVHSGHWAVNVANMSTAFPMGHNWSQTLLVGKEAWGKTATFKVWTRSNGVDGRAFILVQAYSDTATKMARIWGVDHDEALKRLGIGKIDDPLLDLAWKRVWFDDPLTDWVEREAKIQIQPGTNVMFVRCGLIGTGQVVFDDASLTLSAGMPPAKIAKGENLFADPGFEGRALAWDLALPPYEGAKISIDTTVAHGGRMSVRLSDFWDGLVETRIGVGQPFDARAAWPARAALGLVQGRLAQGHRLREDLRAGPHEPRHAVAGRGDAVEHVGLAAALDRAQHPRRRGDRVGEPAGAGPGARHGVDRRRLVRGAGPCDAGARRRKATAGDEEALGTRPAHRRCASPRSSSRRARRARSCAVLRSERSRTHLQASS